jgi:hypothetical protein
MAWRDAACRIIQSYSRLITARRPSWPHEESQDCVKECLRRA